MWTTMWLGVALAAKPVGTDLDQLKTDVAKWEQMLATDGKYQFGWTEDELKGLAKGDFVKRRERLDGADRAIGAMWTGANLDELWVAIQDEEHAGLVKGLIDERLPGSTYQNKLLYQRIDLPWPFADRQWVIKVVNNQPLFDLSEGRCWERTWDVTPERGAKNETEDAVWVEVNDGGWLVADVAGGTLLVYHVRTVIGGNIPEDAATQWSMMTLGGMLKDLVALSYEMPEHYLSEHSVIRRPDGSNIGHFDTAERSAVAEVPASP
ncbi:MAG: hypothetical protein KC912_26300 [Proteobacteria bacterium]|nr:hypothetical protein [Pseudomonadota bacterium]